jgi:hypothetical protein
MNALKLFRRVHLGLAGVLTLLLSPCVSADGAHVPVVAITPQLDLTALDAQNSTLSVDTDKGAPVLSWKVEPNAPAPSFTINPPEGTWDFSAAKGIRALVTNESSVAVPFTIQVANQFQTGTEPFSKDGTVIGPGETRLVQAPFGKIFGHPAFPLDPKAITSVHIYVGGPPSPAERTLVIHSIETFVTLEAQPPEDLQPPPVGGLALWLDPAKESTATIDATRNVSVLADRSGGHHDAHAASPDELPQLSPANPKQRTSLHFTGKEALTVDPIRTTPGGVTVFVVYSGMQSVGPNPTLISSLADPSAAPDKAPNFEISAPGPKDPWRSVRTVSLDNAPIGPLTIGRGFAGDINEVLVYDRTFTDEGDRQKVYDYLKKKWNAETPTLGWLRTAPLDPPPQPTHDDLPLSDQANVGQWTLDPAFSSDFSGTSLDLSRFAFGSSFNWPGSKPGWFSPEDVSVGDNTLKIKLAKGVPPQDKAPAEYTYSSGYVRSKERTGYGYYEIEAKIPYTAYDVAFWFADTGDTNNQTEIDIYEMGTHTPKFANNDYMTVHVTADKGDTYHWDSNTFYHPQWDVTKAYHVYGFEWTAEELKWYIDGNLIREVKNTNWQRPMYLTFDAEPQLSWFGPIDDKDLPAEYDIKHLKVWRQAPGAPSP